MIAEFALTPWVFDQTAHGTGTDDWPFWLNTLASRMFPQPNLCPVLVTDLSGLWESRASQFVDAISHPRAKIYAQRLLQQIRTRLVRRQLAPGAVNPVNESWWAQAGCAASLVEVIDRLIATVGCHAGLTANHPALRPLDTVENDNFWQDVSVEWSPPAQITAQVKTLRKLSVHGEFVWLATPYASGKVDDETPFACNLIADVFRRPVSFAPPAEVELHTELPMKVPLQNHLDSVRQSVRSVVPIGQRVRHVVWRKLLERIVLAGVFTTTSSGSAHAPRWGVHMGHIARPIDARSNATHEWKQLNDRRVGDWFNTFAQRTVPNFVQADNIIS